MHVKGGCNMKPFNAGDSLEGGRQTYTFLDYIMSMAK